MLVFGGVRDFNKRPATSDLFPSIHSGANPQETSFPGDIISSASRAKETSHLGGQFPWVPVEHGFLQQKSSPCSYNWGHSMPPILRGMKLDANVWSYGDFEGFSLK